MHSLPGWVGHHHIGHAFALKEILIEHLAHISSEEVGILDPIQGCILLRILDGLLYSFHTNDLCRTLRHIQSDGSRSAVQIVDDRPLFDTRHIQSDAIKLGGLFRIGLIEGFRSDAKLHVRPSIPPFHLLDDRLLPADQFHVQIIPGIIRLFIHGEPKR